MALTANKVLVSDNNGEVTSSSTDSSKLTYIGGLTSNAEQTGNKVTSLSSANTDTQYPSAKAVYDEIVPNVTDSYAAVSNKGGTLPQTQNLANLATAIGSIPTGGVSTKYGASADTFLGNMDANGVLDEPTEQSDLVFTGVKDVGDYALYYRFVRTKVKSVSFPDLTTVSGNSGCYYMFYVCDLTSVSFPNLTTVSGNSGCYYMFYNCASLTSVSLPNLTKVSGTSGCHGIFNGCTSLTSVSLSNLTTISSLYGGYNMFYNCTALTSISLPNLTTISGNTACYNMFFNSALTSMSFPSLETISSNNACVNMFGGCKNISSISFPALTTTSFGSSNVNQFNNMFNTTSGSTSGSITMHFPSNLETTIQGLTGYPNFGATSGRLTLSFDLPATS